MLMYRFIKYLSITCVLIFVSSMVILFLWPAPPLLQGMNFSRAVYDHEKHLLRLTLSADAKYRLFVPLSAISKSLHTCQLGQGHGVLG